MTKQVIKERYQMFGWSGVLVYLLYQVINKIFYFDHLCLMTLVVQDTDPEYFQPLPQFDAGFLKQDSILSYAKDPKYQLTSDFLPMSLENGDFCYGICQKNQLASYGWYSTKPTKVTSEFKIHFPPEYVYMHHGYTNPDFRGQRLHAFGMAHALKHFSDRDCKGLISIVGGENIPSLKSTKRLGYQIVGKIYLFACLNRYFIFHDRGSRDMRSWLSPMKPEIKSFGTRQDQQPDQAA